jgi:hypothetical protein
MIALLASSNAAPFQFFFFFLSLIEIMTHRDHRLVTLFLNLNIVFSDENALFVFLFQPILARLVQPSKWS